MNDGVEFCFIFKRLTILCRGNIIFVEFCSGENRGVFIDF